jgi:hypothetical protein
MRGRVANSMARVTLPHLIGRPGEPECPANPASPACGHLLVRHGQTPGRNSVPVNGPLPDSVPRPPRVSIVSRGAAVAHCVGAVVGTVDGARQRGSWPRMRGSIAEPVSVEMAGSRAVSPSPHPLVSRCEQPH